MLIYKGEQCEMKKLLTIILATSVALSLAACSKKAEEVPAGGEVNTPPNQIVDAATPAPEQTPQTPEQTTAPTTEPTTAPSTAPTTAPTTEPTTAPVTTPTTEPTTAPVVPTPEPTPEPNRSVGNTLLADFKTRAASGGSALSIAEGLASNSVIKVPVGAIPVEPGYLTGFDNTEIKGFKEGAMFAPMIGTIPFVGYVFTLENAADAPAFISSLKAGANLRWNICTSADEMVTGSAGNKVFFVMSPINFAE